MPPKYTDSRICPKCKVRLQTESYDVAPNGKRYSYCRECRDLVQLRQAEYEISPPNPSGFCMCGCGQHAPLAKANDSRFGLRKGSPVRYVNGHWQQPQSLVIDPEKYDVDPITSCWIWNRARNANGYGILGKNGGGVLAHRTYYEIAKGPIPDRLPLDHLCRRPACVNPDHVEPVTHKINSHRGKSTKLSDDDVAIIRRLEGTMPRKSIAARFGIHYSYVSMIVRGQARKP